jgi:hypothetical protein
MKKSVIKEKRYKKAINIKRNNIKDEEKKDYDCTRKFGLVRTMNTKADRKKEEEKEIK